MVAETLKPTYAERELKSVVAKLNQLRLDIADTIERVNGITYQNRSAKEAGLGTSETQTVKEYVLAGLQEISNKAAEIAQPTLENKTTINGQIELLLKDLSQKTPAIVNSDRLSDHLLRSTNSGRTNLSAEEIASRRPSAQWEAKLATLDGNQKQR